MVHVQILHNPTGIVLRVPTKTALHRLQHLLSSKHIRPPAHRGTGTLLHLQHPVGRHSPLQHRQTVRQRPERHKHLHHRIQHFKPRAFAHILRMLRHDLRQRRTNPERQFHPLSVSYILSQLQEQPEITPNPHNVEKTPRRLQNTLHLLRTRLALFPFGKMLNLPVQILYQQLQHLIPLTLQILTQPVSLVAVHTVIAHRVL